MTGNRSLPCADTDPEVIALAAEWRIRTRAERRELRCWAEEQRLSIVGAKVRAIGYALLVLQHQQDRPQRVTVASGRRRLVVPVRDLEDVEFARWWRASARRWARILVTQRGDLEMPPGHDSDLAIAEDAAVGVDEWTGDENARRAFKEDVALFRRLASAQQRRILDAILTRRPTSWGDADRLLGLTHGQAREQMRRLAEKAADARVPRDEPPPQAQAS